MRSVEAVRRDNTTFVLLSFEGPDPYSRAGRLGERVSNLSETLARLGFETHLLFVGDPDAPGHEEVGNGKLHLHRWCQWISRYHPQGVYQAEDDKLWDFNGSAPPFVVGEIIKRSALKGKLVVVQGEEWHSVDAICRIADMSRIEGLDERVLTLWNANDLRSFDRIDWPRLARSASITTVSKYMKHVMWNLGINPLVIPNGIPRRLLLKPDERKMATLRKGFGDAILLMKLCDWHPGKRWDSAIEALARLKARGKRSILIAGCARRDHGSGAYEAGVLGTARAGGLDVRHIEGPETGVDGQIAALLAASAADIIHVTCDLAEETVRLLYAVSDGVLADSDHEPFGLQGLEAMAAGGVVYTGCTGEDYADPLENAIVLETGAPDEIVEYALYLDERAEEKSRIRKAGRLTAQRHTWEEVIENLMGKIEYLIRTKLAKQGAFIQVPHISWKMPTHISPASVRKLSVSSVVGKPIPRAS